MIKLGIDVGGTFTDLVVIDEDNGKINLTKVPSTPASPDKGVINGIEKISKIFSVDTEKIDFLIHGTTVATNALIERKGVKTAYITTEGFRDVLHIGRQSRPMLYDYFKRRSDSFVSRDLRFEVPERILYTGEIKTPLDEEAVRSVAEVIKKKNIKVVAVCLIHSYANPKHESLIRDILLEIIPDLKVCLSSEVLPEFKEYERASTTVINACVMPIIEKYLHRILNGIKQKKIKSDLHIMQSNGGVMTSETAAKKSVHTVLSGPAAGVLGALLSSKMIGIDNAITIDMGGTSFDVSLIYKGVPTYTTESDIDGHVIKVPMIDIKTLGAGGGSIAWIDPGGALQVGPRSAGADPGPACYCRGGVEPTVSDANIVLGYLNPNDFAGGELQLDPQLAYEAIEKKIAKPLNISVERAAEGILKVVNATMIRGIRLVSVERGHDPREFSLVCFGGAGPVHAVSLAKELNIPKLVIPEAPGVNCALGLLMADFMYDYSTTFLYRIKNLELDTINDKYHKLEKKAVGQLKHDGIKEKDIIFQRSADLRYTGQGYELNIPIPVKRYTNNDLMDICNEYSMQHNSKYGYNMPNDSVEIVNLRLRVIGLISKPELKKERFAGKDALHALKEHRKIYMDGRYLTIPIYDRKLLRCGNELDSPAIIDQADSTTVLFKGYSARVDEYRNLIIEKRENLNNG